MTLKLYHLKSGLTGYNAFSDAVVCALDEKDASLIHPRTLPGRPIVWDKVAWIAAGQPDSAWVYEHEWIAPDNVIVLLIGDAVFGLASGVVCASFHG